MQGVSGFDPGPGEYEIVPSEYQRNLEDFDDVRAGSEGDGEPMWHRFDVKRKGRDTVLEVVEDRRGMEGLLDVSGQQFLLRPPGEPPLMAFSPQGGLVVKPTRLRNTATDEDLGVWKKKWILSRSWEFRDANDEPQLVATQPWSLGTSTQTYRLKSRGGGEIGQLILRKKGDVVAYEADITLEPSSVPSEIALALVCGIFRRKRRTEHDY